MQKEDFKKLIRETIKDMRKPDKSERLKASLRTLVGEVINEIASVSAPEPDEKETEKINKQFAKDGNERVDDSNKDLLEDLQKTVKSIDESWEVYIDDKKDFVVDAKDYLKVRIVQKFENNFDVDAMVKMQDRIRAISLTWDQVKAFVKANFNKELKAKVDDLKDKAMDHLKDKSDKGNLPKHDVIEPRFVSADDHKLKSTKKDDKDYTEDEVDKDEDQPSAPMKTVDDDDVKKQRDHKETKVAPPKHKNDKKLVMKMKIGRGHKRGLN